MFLGGGPGRGKLDVLIPEGMTGSGLARLPDLPGGQKQKEAGEVSGDVVSGFSEWTARYLGVGEGEREVLVAEGMKWAEARRSVFKELIRRDPRGAIEQAVPMVVRQKLPASVVGLLEQRVNGKGELSLRMGVPMNGKGSNENMVKYRKAIMEGGRAYNAHVYGRREMVTRSISGLPLNGVAMDAEFAVSEWPSRRLEVGEVPPAGKEAVVDCPISGKQVFEDAQVIAEVITDQTPAVEMPDQVVYFCDGAHIMSYNDALLLAEGGTGPAIGYTGILPSAPTPSLGVIRVLAIPMTFADQNAAPATEATLYATLRDVSQYYSRSSYGRLTLIATVTPLVKLPYNEAWYINRDTSNGGDIDGEGREHQHAREEARKLGYDSNDFDNICVRLQGGPGSFGGLATVPGNTVWLRTDSAGTWAHEIGHSFGLLHANFWETGGTSSIGSGGNDEYGHSYDVIGTSGSFPNGHYNVQGKNQIRWLTDPFTEMVTSSGQYRIYAQDTGVLDPSRRYALRLVKDAQRTYWGEVRSLFESVPWIKNGLMLGWRFPNASGSNLQLLDTTPGSPFLKEDAPISLGNTFSDTESDIHMTTVAVNDNPRYVDVQVNLGSFPGNQRPTMTLAASAESVPVGATVTFTATAADGDGDVLAYGWQHFGDTSVKIVSPNAPVITRTFSTAGSYVVSCTVSDMKGGTVTRNQLVRVGDGGGRFTIRGQVLKGGQGLQDVVVTANGSNGVVTDADGRYIIPNLTATTYAVTPLLFGYDFDEQFNNPVTVGPHFERADFVATAQPVVSINAPTPTANELAPVTTGMFRLTRVGDTSQSLSVNVNVAQGTATKGTDYSFSPDYVSASQGFNTFTIPAGVATRNVTVTPLADTAQEGPETIVLQLGPGNGYVLNGSSVATVVLNDDDTALPKVSVVATRDRVTENGAQPGVFTVSRTGSTAAALTLNFSVGGTASSGSDFTAVGANVVFPIGASTAVVNVSPINDAISESLETVVLTLNNNANYVRDSTMTSATIQIDDDDTQVVTMAVTDASAREVDLSVSGARADTGTFVVSRSGDVSAPLRVFYSFSGTNGSGVMALHGVDFEALSGSIEIPAGQTQASVTVVPRFDELGEGPEQAVMYLSAASTNYVVGGVNGATVTINDRVGDLPYVGVEVIATNGGTTHAIEGGVSVAFRITVRGGTGTGNLAVNYGLTGTAVAGDYTVGGAGNTATGTTIALNNGATVTKDVTITANNDTAAEDLESLVLTLEAGSYTTYAPSASAMMWVRDTDNTNTVFVTTQVGTSGSVTITEGATTSPVKFYVSRTGSTAAALNVNYTLGGTATSGSDFTALSGSVTITAGSLGADVSVAVINDTVFEGTEKITFEFAEGGYSRGPGAFMNVADNETSAQTVAFVGGSAVGAESVTTVNVPVRLASAATAPVTVEYLADTGSRSSSTVTATVQALPYWVRLRRVGNVFTAAHSPDGTTWTAIGAARTMALPATVLAGLAVCARSDSSTTTATFDNVSLTGAPTLEGRTVGFVNSQGTDSVTGGVFRVTASGAQIGGTEDECHFVSAPVSGDFTLVARVLSQSGGAADAQAGVMIRESVNYRTRSLYLGNVANADAEFIFRETSVSTAIGMGIDHSLAEGVLTFGIGEQTKDITFGVTNDSIVEPNDNVTIVLRNANGAQLGSPVQFTYTIADDDLFDPNPYVGFSRGTSSVLESEGEVSLVVSRSNSSAGVATVDFAVTGGTAAGGGVDFTLDSGTLSFASGETVKSIPVTLVDDSLVDVGETLIVTLSNPQGLQLSSIGVHTMTITDNDLPVVNITATGAMATEGGDSGQFIVTRTGATTAALNVTLARSGTATDATDYASIGAATPFTLTIPAGSSSASVTIAPVNDTSNEGTETVILGVDSNASYVVGASSTATVTLLDNDRSTVTILANDALAAEGGGTGQFTVTRTAPTTGTLTVNLAIAGTAINTTDYATVATTVSFTAGQATRTVSITPVNDSAIEGDELVTLSLASGGYDIGSPSFDSVTVSDNDAAPTLYISSPSLQGSLVSMGNGVILSAVITDDGLPTAVTQSWTQVSGPVAAVIESPQAATTAVSFAGEGSYTFRITATDSAFTVSDEVTVVVGNSLVVSDWITQDLGPAVSRRGQGVVYGGNFSVTGTGAGYAATANDQAHVMVRQASGDGSVVARLKGLTVTTALSGVTIRDSMLRAGQRAVLGYIPGTGLQFRARTAAGNDAVVASQTGLSLPLWLKLERNSVTDAITASYAADVAGAPGTWTQLGASTVVAMDTQAHYGLTTTNNGTGGRATGTFDNVTLTPATVGPALLSEDATTTPASAGSGSLAGSTYTVVGSTSGFYHGWQYTGDMVVTARLVSFSSGAGSAIGGIRLAESMENGGQVHVGRIPTSAYDGYTWRSLAAGGTAGLPSGISSGNWIRVIRNGSRVTAFRASDSGGSPGTWTQIGQPQTVVMTAPVFVGFFVNNATGVGMNTCTFSNLSILPLNKAPVVGIASVASWPLSPIPLNGTVADDNAPTPTALTSQWSRVSGAGTVTFGNAAAPVTTATLSQAGSYTLRLTADDGAMKSFANLAFTGYTAPFEVWQGQNWSAGGGVNDPRAPLTLDPDLDGQANLLEYAFGTSPMSSGPGAVIFDRATVSTNQFLRIRVPKNPAATDVVYEVQATSDLSTPASWSSAGLVVEVNSSSELRVRDSVPMGGGVRRFMRVVVRRL